MNYIEKIELLRKEESELIADLKVQEERLTDSVKNYLNSIKDDDCLPIYSVWYFKGYDYIRLLISFDANLDSEIALLIEEDKNKIELNYSTYGSYTSEEKIPVSVALLVAKIRKNEKSLFNLINELLPDKEKVKRLNDVGYELAKINRDLEQMEKERKRADALAKLKNNKYIIFKRGDDKYYHEIIKITEKTITLKYVNDWEEEKNKLDDIIKAINDGRAEPVNEIKEEEKQ